MMQMYSVSWGDGRSCLLGTCREDCTQDDTAFYRCKNQKIQALKQTNLRAKT